MLSLQGDTDIAKISLSTQNIPPLKSEARVVCINLPRLLTSGSKIKSIDTTMTITYFNLRMRNEILFHLLLTCGVQYNFLHFN